MQNHKTTEMSQQVNYADSRSAYLILRALNHKLRQQILKELVVNEKMNVTDIYVKLRLEQSVASQHLAILRQQGIVKAERKGKEIFYSLNKSKIDTITVLVRELVGI